MGDKPQGNHLPDKENDSPGDPGSSTSPSSSQTQSTAIPIKAPQQTGLSSIAPSPPQFVTMDDIMSAANGLKDMQLFHEIAVNKDFKLAPFEPPENSLQKAVKEAMHRAFWDFLTEELGSDPPVYTRAMNLLEEVKTMLLDLLYPQHEKLKQEINEMIDIPFIQQQAENNALDFLGYAQFIINFMGKICAPGRDEKIQELKSMTDPVQIFRGVLETLTLMRLDLANFEIQMVRSRLMAQSVTYEKTKFAEALSLQGGIETLTNTKKWLKRHLENTPNGSDKDIILSAYLELFEWNLEEEFPETVLMDSVRHRDLGRRLQQLIISGTVLLVTLCRAGRPALQQSTSFKEKLLQDVGVLLQGVRTDEELKSCLPNIAVQASSIVKKYVNEGTESGPVLELDDNFEQALTELIQEIYLPDHNVRRVVRERTNEFLHLALSSAPNIPKQVPPGMSSLRSELLSVTGSIVRIYQYNLAVFSEYYHQIITKIKEEKASTL